jgi:hypothetical protein
MISRLASVKWAIFGVLKFIVDIIFQSCFFNLMAKMISRLASVIMAVGFLDFCWSYFQQACPKCNRQGDVGVRFLPAPGVLFKSSRRGLQTFPAISLNRILSPSKMSLTRISTSQDFVAVQKVVSKDLFRPIFRWQRFRQRNSVTLF